MTAPALMGRKRERRTLEALIERAGLDGAAMVIRAKPGSASCPC